MPRIARYAPKGLVYHALNRAVARLPLFQKEADYEAFERVIDEAHEKFPVEILAYCVMPNHWHFVLRPTKDGQLTAFLRCVAHTHTMRWHAHYHTSGTGHLYQGRFKAFPVEDDDHFYTVVRYVERNALRAGLVAQAQAWRWSSLWRHASGDVQARALLARWPLSRPRAWVEFVNAPQTDAELESLRRAVRRSSPFGDLDWQHEIAKRLGLQSTLRPAAALANKPPESSRVPFSTPLFYAQILRTAAPKACKVMLVRLLRLRRTDNRPWLAGCDGGALTAESRCHPRAPKCYKT